MKDFKEKFNEWINEGVLSKLILLIVVAGISFFPFFTVQKNLKKSLGDQPKMFAVIYGSIFLLVLIVALAIIKTRPKNKS